MGRITTEILDVRCAEGVVQRFARRRAPVAAAAVQRAPVGAAGSRQAYENGVVIVRCPGCQVQHLVADRYGWFGEPGSVEDFLGSRGETVVTGRAGAPGIESEDGTLEIDREQLEAWTAKQARGAGKTGVDV